MATKQTIRGQFFLKRNNIPFEKSSGQFRAQVLCRPRRIFISSATVLETQRNLNSFWTEPNITTSNFDHSVNKIILREKVYYPIAITRINRYIFITLGNLKI